MSARWINRMLDFIIKYPGVEIIVHAVLVMGMLLLFITIMTVLS
jgi:hypothetical protein